MSDERNKNQHCKREDHQLSCTVAGRHEESVYMFSPRKETSPRATETDHLEFGSEGGHESAIVNLKKAESQSMLLLLLLCCCCSAAAAAAALLLLLLCCCQMLM